MPRVPRCKGDCRRDIRSKRTGVRQRRGVTSISVRMIADVIVREVTMGF